MKKKKTLNTPIKRNHFDSEKKRNFCSNNEKLCRIDMAST